MKLIAAMSGGVDSAVAAARAVEEGHDVIGVHLALSSNHRSIAQVHEAAARSKIHMMPGEQQMS
jgi:tRNA U34 2-thiouridine synthase MnmA/TrmU